MEYEIMTAQEVAEYLRIDQRTVTQHAMRGVIPGRQFGKLWRFSRKAIVALLYDPENAETLSERVLGADRDGIRSGLVHTLHHAGGGAPAPAHRDRAPVPVASKGFKSGTASARSIQ